MEYLTSNAESPASYVEFAESYLQHVLIASKPLLLHLLHVNPLSSQIILQAVFVINNLDILDLLFAFNECSTSSLLYFSHLTDFWVPLVSFKSNIEKNFWDSLLDAVKSIFSNVTSDLIWPKSRALRYSNFLAVLRWFIAKGLPPPKPFVEKLAKQANNSFLTRELSKIESLSAEIPPLSQGADFISGLSDTEEDETYLF